MLTRKKKKTSPNKKKQKQIVVKGTLEKRLILQITPVMPRINAEEPKKFAA